MLVPKWVAMHGNVSQHRWTPIWHMIPLGHPSPQPKRHLNRFRRFCTDDRRVSLYFTMGRPFPPRNCFFPWGIWTPSNTWHLGPPESLTQTASWLVQPFLQGWLVWQTDRPTDHATRSVTKESIYVRSTAMRPNNSNWSKNFDERPHHRRTWTVQSYSLGGANVHPYLTHASLSPP